nr:ribosomal L7Ae/L30e/S12e/Gadd45 family protein [Kosmotoga pacifica]
MLSYLGFARKANRIVFGKEMIRSYLRENRRKKVLIVASDTSDSIKLDWRKRCQSHGAFYVELEHTNKLNLARAVGLNNISAIGITDEGLAAEIIKLVRPGGEDNAKDQSV